MQNNPWEQNQNPTINNPPQVGAQPQQPPVYQGSTIPQVQPQVQGQFYQPPPYQPPMMSPYPPPQPTPSLNVVSTLNQPLLGPSPTVVNVITPEEDNCCLGCCMGTFFGIFGLLCLCCVRDRSSYLKGWLVPFIINTILIVLAIVLIAVFASRGHL